MMTKRAQGRKRFGRRNFKQRFFRMTTHSLCYSKAKGKRVLCDIPLSEILTVKKVDERSFKMQNIFEVSRDVSFCIQLLLNDICLTSKPRSNYNSKQTQTSLHNLIIDCRHTRNFCWLISIIIISSLPLVKPNMWHATIYFFVIFICFSWSAIIIHN